MSWLQPLAVALGFLTRLPVYPRHGVEEADHGRSLAWFPLAGAVLGAILWAADWVVRGRVSGAVEAAMLVALLAWLTGGLHLDGLADVFDGLSGGHGDRHRTLEIMRDSRIGAHGAAALILVLLLKAVALAEVLPHHRSGLLLVIFPMVSRFAMVVLVYLFPYARPEGLGSAFKRHGRPVYLVMAMATVALALAAAHEVALRSSAVALAAALIFAGWISRRLGGLTGDVYGASAELAEVAFLVATGVWW